MPCREPSLGCTAAVDATVTKVLGGGVGAPHPLQECSLGMYCNRL